MTINVLSRQVHTVLGITDTDSIEDLKREIDDFISQIKPGDKFSVEVTMTTRKGRYGGIAAKQSSGNIQDIITAFEIAIGNRKVRTYLREQGVSRSTWYNWKAGLPIGRASLEKLIEIAPTQEVRDALIAVRISPHDE